MNTIKTKKECKLLYEFDKATFELGGFSAKEKEAYGKPRTRFFKCLQEVKAEREQLKSERDVAYQSRPSQKPPSA